MTASTSPLLEVRGLTKHYGGVKALQEVSFSLNPGQTLGVIGPNGSGKSTLLGLLAGSLAPTQGELRWQGERIDGRPNHAFAHLGIARARQVPRPFRGLTVRENLLVAANAVIHDRAQREALVTSALDDCGLLARQHVRASQLGLLDLKRLEVARALSVAPRLLLLDEVAGGLLAAEVEAMAELIERIQARGLAIVIVEHVQGVIARLASHAIALDWGRLIAQGTPAQVMQDPQVISVYFGDEAATQAPEPSAERTPVGEDVVLAVHDLHVNYGGLHALNGVNLRLRQGEVLGLIGANGAGKTTLCRAIAGLVPAQQGTVQLLGQDISQVAAHRRARQGLAICHEGRRLFTGLTIQDNLMLGAAFAGTDAAQAQQRLAQVQALFPLLRERADTMAGALSGGQQQMVAIGRALMASPRVLLLDELSLGLAPLVIETIYQSLAQIRDMGISILLVEQNTHRCLRVADRVYVLERGAVSYEGPPQGLLANDRLRQAYFGSDH